MFAFIRRRLFLIRYHSAARPVTKWTRAMEAALVGSLALALPAALLMDRLVSRPVESLQLQGRLMAGEGGLVEAMILDPRVADLRWREGAPLGTFSIDLGSRAHGWPRITSWRHLPPTISIDLFSEPPRQGSLRVAEGEHERIIQAITAAVEGDQPRETLARFRRAEATAEWRPWSMITGALLLWVMIYFAAALLIQLLRFATFYVQERQRARAADFISRGLCPACGYDTRGTEFHARCPECGELVW